MTKPFPVATGITGVVARFLGIHPLAAAALKYVLMGGAIFGGYQIWKANVKEDIVQEIVIEEQGDVIDQQQINADDNYEDAASKDSHAVSAAERELRTTKTHLRNQSARLQALEEENEALKNYANERPCIREPWPSKLQRRGGFDLNQGDKDEGLNSSGDRRSDEN